MQVVAHRMKKLRYTETPNKNQYAHNNLQDTQGEAAVFR